MMTPLNDKSNEAVTSASSTSGQDRTDAAAADLSLDTPAMSPPEIESTTKTTEAAVLPALASAAVANANANVNVGEDKAPVTLSQTVGEGHILGPRHGLGTLDSEEEERRRRAVLTLQRVYRGHKIRRELKGMVLSPSELWDDAIEQAQFKRFAAQSKSPERYAVGPDGGSRPLSPSKEKWKKAMFAARMAQRDYSSSSYTEGYPTSSSSSSSDEGNKENRPTTTAGNETTSEAKQTKKRKNKGKGKDSSGTSGDIVHAHSNPHPSPLPNTGLENTAAAKKAKEQIRQDRKLKAKMMDLQYFLEMVDAKHRYGANLKPYHEYWQQQKTKDNFFHWLDYGEGKDLDLSVVPREQLDRERVLYLTREQRLQYLVTVKKDGKLCWAKNGELIDTYGKFINTENRGVIKESEATAEELEYARSVNKARPRSSSSSSSSSPSSSSSSSSSSNSVDADRYVNASKPKGIKKVTHVSPAVVLNNLLRTTTKANTWIFVADMSFRLYVGIKKSGNFQHSSFLHGARVAAAGLLKIKKGTLKSISPLSGHYRPPAANFRLFLKALKEEHVDMKHVRVSKSYAVLLGLEAYSELVGKTKKVKKKLRGETEDTEGNKVRKGIMPLRKSGESERTSKFEGGDGGDEDKKKEEGPKSPRLGGKHWYGHKKKGSASGSTFGERIRDFFSVTGGEKENIGDRRSSISRQTTKTDTERESVSTRAAS